MRMLTGMIVAMATMAVTGCIDNQRPLGAPLAGAASATADIRDAAGVTLGRAMATEALGGLRISLEAHGLTPGLHGTHLHAVGRCDPPGFESAGGHWNPTLRQHGSQNPMGPHQGDLPNLIVGRDGRGTLAATIPGASLAGLLDADGASIVIHAGADDLTSDPAGGSGARIACGVFAAS